MQRKQEEEALARKNQRRGHPNTNGNANNAIGTHSNSTSTPSADSHHQPQQARRGNPHHNYDEIDSPLKDALMQQSNHQQGPGYSDHLRPPRRDLDFHDDPRYNHPSRNRDDHRYDGRDELDRAVQQQNNNYNNFPSNQSNYSSYDRNGNNYSMNHNMTNSSYNYRDSRDSYYQDSGSSYARRMRALEAEADAAAEAEERRFDLSLVAESRLIQPDTSGLLADLLPRRPAPPASSSSPAASSSLLEAYPRRERALDLEKSLASASTFLYMSEQTPLSLDQQRPPSSSSSASLTQVGLLCMPSSKSCCSCNVYFTAYSALVHFLLSVHLQPLCFALLIFFSLLWLLLDFHAETDKPRSLGPHYLGSFWCQCRCSFGPTLLASTNTTTAAATTTSTAYSAESRDR